MRRLPLQASLVVLCLGFSWPARAPAAEPKTDFARQIAPILAARCVRCHSPGNPQGEISLATIDDLRENEYLVAGDPDSSYLLDLVTSSDGKPPRMPKDADPLPADQVEALRRWIGEGAPWPSELVVREKSQADLSWWSYQPLDPAEPPAPEGIPAEWSDNPIDRFVHAGLSQRGLQPSPPADRRTLARRLAFDLHGLPPRPEMVDAFVRDPDPWAYEKLVDRLLNAPQYGERLAQHWLDIAHYADTHGFERDQRRDHAWRYRDYVIRSLNEDKPYSRFLQEQIAGDVLWPDDPQAVIATGFLAAGPWDFVGQVETRSEQLRRAARSLDLDDMATQVLTATMAMTIHCARCHDHKLDPITQEEYYRLRAVFAGIRRADRVTSEAAVRAYESARQRGRARLNEIDFALSRLEGQGLDLADIVGGGNGLGSGSARHGIDPRSAKLQTRDFGALGNVVTNRFVQSDLPFVDGVFIPQGGDDGPAEIAISSTGVVIRGLPKTSGAAWDAIRNGPVASQHSPELDGVDFTRPPHTLLGLHANAGITFDLAAIREATGHGPLRFTAQVGYFGAAGDFRADAWVFLDGRQVAAFRSLSRDRGLQPLQIELPPETRFLTLISTDGGNGYSHDQVGFGSPKLRPAMPAELNDDQRRQLTELRDQRREAEQQFQSLGPPPRFYGVVSENQVPDVRVLLRGDPESPTGQPLDPAALAALAMLDPSLGTRQSAEGSRRAALARWITHPDNPLTPRVIVNRLWQWHFGQGLVRTPSDFGFGGGRPSHPELLDWLAAELARRGGSLKSLQRQILLSQTYRQQSRHTDDSPGHSLDADNRLLWRQNPRRLDAESIRDSVLQVSGTLNGQRGGPGFEDFRYQDAYAPIYEYVPADEPALWRRSIYRYVVRTTPNHFLTTFDCPDPANLTPRRLTTTTPLQSLALYNNEFMLKQAGHFAARLEREAGADEEAQVRRAFRLAFARQPSADELPLALALVRGQGLFSLCRALLNSNEFLYVD